MNQTVPRSILDAMRPRIEAWKDKYKGERCFCIGNGPSLKDTPLYLLEDEYTFGLNRIADIYPSTSWRPSFYVNVTIMTTDAGWAKSSIEAIKNTPSFVWYGLLPSVLDTIEDEVMISYNVFPVEVTKERPQDGFSLDIWSHDIAERVSKYGSSMLAVLQIAVYMGFNPIYLLGCDLGWKPFDYEENKDPNHFSEDYWGRAYPGTEVVVTPRVALKYTTDALASHALAKEACDSIGVEIYNATVGGELEVYPRADLLEVLCC